MFDGNTNAIVSTMLSWLKGLASWVLKLFNLAGSGGSPLLWLSENWLKLLIVLMIIGIGMDWLIWMIRWRPYWVWFKKKRIIINDEKFFADEKYVDDRKHRDAFFEEDYVIPSTVVKRKTSTKKTSAAKSPNKRSLPEDTRKTLKPKETSPITPHSHDIFLDEMFEVGHDRDTFSDFYEDEVFDVSNLPKVERTSSQKRKKKKR